MKKILYVEDDVLIARVYSQKLVAEGFDVVVAADGLAAVQRLREFTPDLVVLDLLMPKLTGVDVLKFIRSQPGLKDVRIIVFSNSFLSNLVEQVSRIGVEEALIKASVTPTQLVGVIRTTLEQPSRNFITAASMARQVGGGAGLAGPASPSALSPTGSLAEKDFALQLPGILAGVRQICGDFLEAGDSPIEPRKLEDLRRKIGFVAQTLGVGGRHQAAQLCSALEAMLFEFEEKPATITDSNRHTIASTVALLADQLEGVPATHPPSAAPLKVLAVDDDVVSSRAVVLALGRARLAATSVSDPFDALKRLQENSYDLVLLDINMPGMDGITLCEQMRQLPLHKQTPVIFVTSQADFKTRARSVLSGGNDLVAKPILPTELCVKALAHLLKRPVSENPAVVK